MKFQKFTSALVLTLTITLVIRCACPEGQIEITPGVCSCVENCLNCNNGECLSCFPNYSFFSEEGSNTPVCKADDPDLCRADQYANPTYIEGSTVAKCLQCKDKITNCNICLGESTCLVCQNGFSLSQSGSSCNSACVTGQHWNATTLTCENCGSYCDSCSSATNCLRCKNGFRLNSHNENNSCVTCDTSNGYYIDNTTGSSFSNNCFKCSRNCKTCSNSGKCLTCKTGYELMILDDVERAFCYKRKDTCDPSEFISHIKELETINNPDYDPTDSTSTAGSTIQTEVYRNICFHCHRSCLTCKGPEHTRCLTCDSNKNLELFKGRCVCKSGFFYSAVTSSCIACGDEGCGVCSGPGRDKCLSCPSPSQILYFNKCVDCSTQASQYPQICKTATIEMSPEYATIDNSVNHQANYEFDRSKILIREAPHRDIYSFKYIFHLPNSAKFADFIEKNQNQFNEVFELTMVDKLMPNLPVEFDHKLIFNKEKESLDVEVLLRLDYDDLEIQFQVKNPGVMNNIGNPLEEFADFSGELWNNGKFVQTLDGEHTYKTWEQEIDYLNAEYKERNRLSSTHVFSSQTIRLRRVLQGEAEASGPAPIFGTGNQINTTGAGRRVPTTGQVDFAKYSGEGAQYYLLGLLGIGILLMFVKLCFKVEVDIHFAKLIVVSEFLARTSLINVNLGHLLYQFFDRIFNLDMWFMWDVTNEEAYRGRLGGKLDQYNISMLTVNSSFLAMAAYLVRKIIFKTPF